MDTVVRATIYCPGRRRFVFFSDMAIITCFIVFYHSPKVIYRALQVLTYSFSIILTVSLLYGFWHTAISMYGCYIRVTNILVFGPLLALTSLIALLYILRFNYIPLKNFILRITGHAEKIVIHPKRRHHHYEQEHEGFRIASFMMFSIASFGIEILVMLTVLIMVGWQSFLFFFALCFSVCFVVYKRFESDAADAMAIFFVIFLGTIGGVFVLG